MSPNIENSEFNIKTVVAIILGVITLMGWMYNTIVLPLKEVQISVAQFDSRITKLENKIFPNP